MDKSCRHLYCTAKAIQSGYCDKHQDDVTERKPFAGVNQGAPGKRGYTAAWFAFSKQFLSRHPWCAFCSRPATVTHHHLLTAKQMMETNGAFILMDEYYLPACSRCNTAHFQRYERRKG